MKQVVNSSHHYLYLIKQEHRVEELPHLLVHPNDSVLLAALASNHRIGGRIE